MGASNRELSSAEQKAGAAAVSTERVRVVHYGTGKRSSSPVLLHLPRTLGVLDPIPTTLGFAEEFRWLYENGFSASANLGYWYREIRAGLDHGDFDRAASTARDTRRAWRTVTPVPVFDYVEPMTLEERYLDRVGHIAVNVDNLDADPESYHGMWASHWGHFVQVPHRRRAWRRNTAVVALTGAVVASAVTLGEWPLLLGAWMPPLGWRTKFEYSKVATLTLTKWAAYEALPNPAKAATDERRAVRERTRHEFAVACLNLSDEAVFDLACRIIRDDLVEQEARRARRAIEQQISALPDDPLPRPTLLGKILAEGDVIGEAPDIDLLRAADALLDEFRERDLAAADMPRALAG